MHNHGESAVASSGHPMVSHGVASGVQHGIHHEFWRLEGVAEDMQFHQSAPIHEKDQRTSAQACCGASYPGM
jgi:hypothetical protein